MLLLANYPKLVEGVVYEAKGKISRAPIYGITSRLWVTKLLVLGIVDAPPNHLFLILLPSL